MKFQFTLKLNFFVGDPRMKTKDCDILLIIKTFNLFVSLDNKIISIWCAKHKYNSLSFLYILIQKTV